MFGFKSDFIIMDKSDKRGYKDVDLVGSHFRRPIVVALSGNGAIDKESAYGFCHSADRALELLFDNSDNNLSLENNIDILGVSYMPFGESGMLMPEDVQNFVYTVLVPRVSDVAGNLYPIDKCKKNLSGVVFYSYCWGAGEVNNIIKFFTFKLKQYGATNEEISEMLSAMTQISYSPVKLQFIIPTIFARSELDSINTEYNQRYEEIYGEPLQGIKVAPLDNSLGVYSSNLLNKVDDNKDEHSIAYILRDSNWDIRKHEGIANPNADCVSLMISWALSRAVENAIDNHKSDKYVPRTGKMSEELNSILHSFDYEDIISK